MLFPFTHSQMKRRRLGYFKPWTTNRYCSHNMGGLLHRRHLLVCGWQPTEKKKEVVSQIPKREPRWFPFFLFPSFTGL